MSNLIVAEPPARNGRKPGSVPDRVLSALERETRPVRPADIAAKTGMSTTTVANALRVLTLRGDVIRLRNAMVRNGPGASEYIAASNAVQHTGEAVASGVTSGVG